MQPVSAMRCSICCKMEHQDKNLEKKQKPNFPMFVDLSERKILCIGGGKIAARRIRTLTKFTAHLIVVSPEICEEMRELLRKFPITWIQKKMGTEEKEAILNVVGVESVSEIYMVLAATNDHKLNQDLVRSCKEKGILVNTCDDKLQCDFYFPAVTEIDGVVIGLNSGGNDPKKVKKVRQEIEKISGKDPERGVD